MYMLIFEIFENAQLDFDVILVWTRLNLKLQVVTV